MKRINLLISSTDYRQIEEFFSKFRGFTLIYSALLTLGLIIFLLASSSVSSEIQRLNTEKTAYLTQIKSINNEEASLNYIAKKVELVDQYLAEDAKFIPYYNLLVGSLQQATASATLTSFSIDSGRSVNFQVSFRDFAEMIGFFQHLESDEFLKNFENLTLTDFTSVDVQREGAQDARLSFTGKFKELQ